MRGDKAKDKHRRGPDHRKRTGKTWLHAAFDIVLSHFFVKPRHHGPPLHLHLVHLERVRSAPQAGFATRKITKGCAQRLQKTPTTPMRRGGFTGSDLAFKAVAEDLRGPQAFSAAPCGSRRPDGHLRR